ncbi:MAG: hypothetical protein GXO50_08730 [Chlorobi bacterium]|nr:hypothetical protein [Chlorobiota bacterium]
MISYKLNTKTGILETTFKGNISMQDIIDYISALAQDKTLPQKLKVLSDASKAKLAGEPELDELMRIVETNKKAVALKDGTYDAFIISGSVETALGQIYMDLSKTEKYMFKVFSTKKAALEWLNKF